MKRTLTAAATLVVSSAGAVGFAGTANAAEPSTLPAELPVDNNLAQTTFHLVGTLHSAKGVVGDVVPMDKSATGDPAARDAAAREKHIELSGTVENLLEKVGLGPKAPAPPRLVGSTLPAQPSTGEARNGGDPVGNVIEAVPDTHGVVPGQSGGDLVGEHVDTAPLPPLPPERADNTTPSAGQALSNAVHSVLEHGALGAVGNVGG